MNKVLLLFVTIFGILLLTNIVNAETSFYVERAKNYSLNIGCENNGADCSASATCNLSINYPNSTILVANMSMHNLNNGKFKYNLSHDQTIINGEYRSRVNCDDGGESDTSEFIYEVNPAGIRPSDQKTESITRGIYFTLIIGVLFFVAFLFSTQSIPAKWTYFGVACMFFLITLNILFVGMQTEVVNPKLETFFDSFTAISWYIFWFIFGFLILMWAFTMLNTWVFKKNMENLRKYGEDML